MSFYYTFCIISPPYLKYAISYLVCLVQEKANEALMRVNSGSGFFFKILLFQNAVHPPSHKHNRCRQ